MIKLLNTKSIRVRQDSSRVVLIDQAGRTVADMPWQAALQLADAIRSKAKLAEEIDNAKQIIADHAILMRAGVPIGLTNHPGLQAEAAKEAVSNRKLRRYMPGGVKSQEIVGTPTITQHPPKDR